MSVCTVRKHFEYSDCLRGQSDAEGPTHDPDKHEWNFLDELLDES